MRSSNTYSANTAHEHSTGKKNLKKTLEYGLGEH